MRPTRGEGGLGLGADDAFGAITGLLGPDERLEAAYESTGDLAAAAYDPQTKRLYVVSDAVVANRALVEFVLAHELDHAIEDQNFGLPGADAIDDDQALAETALTEGSATSVMTDYAARNLDPFELLAATDGIDTGTGAVPKAYVDQLTWAYLGGLRFINALRELAGSWKLVDYALESRPPASTEQILHPRKYVQDERPDPVRIDGAPLRAAGWRPADRDVLGELPTSQLLELGVEHPVAKRAAAGWDGDRYELWRRDVSPADCEYPCRSDLVLAAKWRFDTRGDPTAVRARRGSTSSAASTRGRADAPPGESRRIRAALPVRPRGRAGLRARGSSGAEDGAGAGAHPDLRRSPREPLAHAPRRLLDLRRHDALHPPPRVRGDRARLRPDLGRRTRSPGAATRRSPAGSRCSRPPPGASVAGGCSAC